MANITCPACGNSIPNGGRVCPVCSDGLATASEQLPAMPRRAGKRFGFFKFLVVFFVVGVGAQFGWQLWKDHQRKASADAFYALARPLLGTWREVEGPDAGKYTYTTRFLPNQSSFLPGQAPETLFLDCVENPRAAQWTLSSAVDGRLVGGGVDQTPEPPDFYTAHGAAEPSPDGRRLTLRMTWDQSRDVVTVLERVGPPPK
jgi:hypothetical protein